MKSSKFQFDLTNDLIITEENVQAIGERVALGSVRFLMRRSGTMLVPKEDRFPSSLRKSFQRVSVFHKPKTTMLDTKE